MDAILMIIKLLGGLVMFLYGMETMGDGLKQGPGNTLKNVLGKLTQNALLGVITGALVTAVIQSSTATIVLTVIVHNSYLAEQENRKAQYLTPL